MLTFFTGSYPRILPHGDWAHFPRRVLDRASLEEDQVGAFAPPDSWRRCGHFDGQRCVLKLCKIATVASQPRQSTSGHPVLEVELFWATSDQADIRTFAGRRGTRPVLRAFRRHSRPWFSFMSSQRFGTFILDPGHHPEGASPLPSSQRSRPFILDPQPDTVMSSTISSTSFLRRLAAFKLTATAFMAPNTCLCGLVRNLGHRAAEMVEDSPRQAVPALSRLPRLPRLPSKVYSSLSTRCWY